MRTLLVFLSVICINLASVNGQHKTIKIDDNLQLIHLQDSVFVHVSWHTSEQFGRFPSNGLLIIRNGEAVMVDTPMTNEQTKQLCDYLKTQFNTSIKALIAGHFHDDCIGGLAYLKSIGAKSLAHQLTIEKCKEEKLPVPDIAFDKEYDCLFNNEEIECRYFGGGHSFDNITVWLPKQKILFGGCLIKSIHSKGLGNLSDAVVDDWDTTVEQLMFAYPDVKIVIPGHGNYGDAELLSHTIVLVKEFKQKQ